MPPAHTFFYKSKMLLLKRNNGNNGNKNFSRALQNYPVIILFIRFNSLSLPQTEKYK